MRFIRKLFKPLAFTDLFMYPSAVLFGFLRNALEVMWLCLVVIVVNELVIDDNKIYGEKYFS